MTRVLNADGEIHYSYNLLGQQTQMWTGTSTALSNGATGVEYEYDVFGRLSLVREVRRDNATLSESVETNSTFNFAGELNTIAVTQGATSLRNTAYVYSPSRGWLTNMTNRNTAGGTVLSTFTYTRRVDGQITNVSETVNQPTGSPVVTTNAYTYDALNRLTREEIDTSTVGSDYTTDYTLDLVGNRVKRLERKRGRS